MYLKGDQRRAQIARQSLEPAMSRSTRRSQRVRSQNENRNGISSNPDLFKDDDDESARNSAPDPVYNFTRDLSNVINRPINFEAFSPYSRGATIEDKPPDYKELFPLKTFEATNLVPSCVRNIVVTSAPHSSTMPVTTLETNLESTNLTKVWKACHLILRDPGEWFLFWPLSQSVRFSFVVVGILEVVHNSRIQKCFFG